MPPRTLPHDALLTTLMSLFREHGYDGTSMSLATEATGLGKSSLYHHFPGGKEAMAAAVLEHLGAQLAPALEATREARPPARKLDALLDALDHLYDGGRTACLLERLCASADRRAFARPLAASFEAVLDAFARIGREAGVSAAEARHRAEDAVVRIEGALVVAAGVADVRVFSRALAQIRAAVLAPPTRRTRRA